MTRPHLTHVISPNNPSKHFITIPLNIKKYKFGKMSISDQMQYQIIYNYLLNLLIGQLPNAYLELILDVFISRQQRSTLNQGRWHVSYVIARTKLHIFAIFDKEMENIITMETN